jgi:hypothetical protein
MRRFRVRLVADFTPTVFLQFIQVLVDGQLAERVLEAEMGANHIWVKEETDRGPRAIKRKGDVAFRVSPDYRGQPEAFWRELETWSRSHPAAHHSLVARAKRG